MPQDQSTILVYAHWQSMESPLLMGELTALETRGHLTWSFSYHPDWLESTPQQVLDPDLQWFSGSQYTPNTKSNFGVFLDSMPDRWGRTLMQKREALLGDQKRLTEVDYLLGVYDPARIGGLRFKTDLDGPFLDNDSQKAIPPITDVRELQYGAEKVESDRDSEEVRKWLRILLAPGSSLGGARPKSSVRSEEGDLYIAKFPSQQDTYDVGAWEYLAWQLATEVGIRMAPSHLEKVTGRYHTFFTKRFDRDHEERIHFASAMTMTGHFEQEIRANTPSYLELAEFLQFHGADPQHDLHQLWRRIIFNIAISNTDDHLRNHGFLLEENGWRLAPAYDINPSIDKSGLALNINLQQNALDIDLAKEVGPYFQLDEISMDTIIEEVLEGVRTWKSKARNLGIPTTQIKMMETAFMV